MPLLQESPDVQNNPYYGAGGYNPNQYPQPSMGGGARPQQDFGYEQYVSEQSNDLGPTHNGVYMTGPYAGMRQGEAMNAMREQYAKMSPQDRSRYESRTFDKDVRSQSELQNQGYEFNDQVQRYADKSGLAGQQPQRPTFTQPSMSQQGNAPAQMSPAQQAQNNPSAVYNTPQVRPTSYNPPQAPSNAPTQSYTPSMANGSAYGNTSTINGDFTDTRGKTGVSDAVAAQGGLINGIPASQAAAKANQSYTGQAGAPLTLDQAMRNNQMQQAAHAGAPIAMQHNQVDPNKYNSPTGTASDGYKVIGDFSGIAQSKFDTSLPFANPAASTQPSMAQMPNVIGNAGISRPMAPSFQQPSMLKKKPEDEEDPADAQNSTASNNSTLPASPALRQPVKS